VAGRAEQSIPFSSSARSGDSSVMVATKPSGPPGRWYLSREDRGPVNHARDHGDDRLAGVELHQITESSVSACSLPPARSVSKEK
jgi:hypothetical protein